MKKIFLLLFLFVLAKTGYSQFPITQYLGSDSAIVKSRGGLQGRFAPIPFTDTSQANTSRISQYPGALIYTSGVDKYWYRNGTVTGWIEFTSSGGATTNIYNSDGTLTGNRQVLGGNAYNLNFDGMQLFGVTASAIDLTSAGTTVGINDSLVVDNTLGVSIRYLSSDNDTTTYKPLGYDPVTGKVVTRSSWVGGGGGIPTLQEVLATQGNNALITASTDISPDASGKLLFFGDAAYWQQISFYSDTAIQLNSRSSLQLTDSVLIAPHVGQLNIDSLRSWTGTTISDTTYKKVMTWDTRNGRVEYSNWLGAGGGGSGTVTSVGTGYGLSGGTITTTGTILVDSASLSSYYLRRKDSLTSSNLFGYVTRTVLADSASAIRSAIIGGGTPAGNYGNIQLNRNGAFAAAGSDSLNFTGGAITVKGEMTMNGASPVLNFGTAAGNPEIAATASSLIFRRNDLGAYIGVTLGDIDAGANKFVVTGGNILKINNVATSFPSSQGAANSFLMNNGSGTLTWDASVVLNTRTISTTSPLSGGGDLSANRTLSIADAAADGTTKGAASFTASDFNSSAANISIDYTNGQKATSVQPGFMTATQAAKLDSNIYFQSGEGVEIYVVNDSTYGFKLKYDTTALASFGAGSAAAGDTTAFSTSAIYGSFFNSGSDTLIITRMQIGLQGTSPNITLDVFWNDSLNVSAGATKLVTTGNTATNIYTGTSVTSFDNTKIPPGNWVWVKSSTVAVKPTYLTTTLIGYKKRVTP